MCTLLLNTWFGDSGTKFESFPDFISTFFVFAVLMSPFLILSLMNRLFFGRIACSVNGEGILYGEKMIKWDKIDKIEYEINPSMNAYSKARGENCCFARLIGDDTEVKILHAPILLMRKCRKYKVDIETGFTIGSILLLATGPAIAVAMATIIFAAL